MKAMHYLLATVLCLAGFGVYQRYKRPTAIELPSIKQFPEVPDQQTHESFKVAELLVSHNPEQRDHGEELWRENRTRIMDDISQRLHSRHPVILCSAAYDLKLLISPWMRGREQSRRHAGMMAIHQLTRPVERVASLPEAPMIRKVLQQELEWMAKTSTGTPQGQGLQFSQAFTQMVQVLGEVADDPTVDWSIDFLGKIRPVQLGEPIFAMIDSYFGVPASFRRGPLLCGLSSDSERAAHAASQSHKMEMAKMDVREIWSELRTMSTDERINYAINEWRKLIIPNMQASSVYYHQYGWLDERWEPLIRFGSSAIPALRAQQEQTPQFHTKALWECIIAAIEGSADGELIRELLEKDPETACEIIAVTGSKQWAKELEQLGVRNHLGKASEALAACFYEECIPILERIKEAEPNQTTAGYLLQEFDRRAEKGFSLSRVGE
jgi:hypothetical protein